MKVQLASQAIAKTEAPRVPEIMDAKSREVAALTENAFQLERILAEVATPEKVKKWLIDICEAEDVRLDRNGEEWRSPDWEARVKGIDRVMAILHYTSKEPKVTLHQPTKIMIQVIDNKPAA